MITFRLKIWLFLAAAPCLLTFCSQPPVILGQDFPAEEVKYAEEASREVKEVPGVDDFHWGRVEYTNFKNLLYEEAQKDKTAYRDLPHMLQEKKKQGKDVDPITLAQMQKHLNAAIERLEAATDINPKYALAFLVLGLSYYQLQKYEDALSALRKVTEFHPDAANTYVTMAMCYLNMGKRKESLDCANQALKIEPDNRDAQLVIQEIERSLR